MQFIDKATPISESYIVTQNLIINVKTIKKTLPDSIKFLRVSDMPSNSPLRYQLLF